MSTTTKYNVSVDLIDVCYPDFLQTHCNGDNEFLLVVYAYQGMTSSDLRHLLMDDYLTATNLNDEIPDLDEEAVTLAIFEEAYNYRLEDLLRYVEYDEEGNSEVCLYFRLSWQAA